MQEEFLKAIFRVLSGCGQCTVCCAQSFSEFFTPSLAPKETVGSVIQDKFEHGLPKVPDQRITCACRKPCTDDEYLFCRIALFIDPPRAFLPYFRLDFIASQRFARLLHFGKLCLRQFRSRGITSHCISFGLTAGEGRFLYRVLRRFCSCNNQPVIGLRSVLG